jgi:hypothetical protein
MEDTKKKNIDSLFWLFISLSAIWTIRVFWLFYQDQYNPYIHSSMPLNEVGDFLAGSFSPLAFFWLAYGYFMQNKELKNQIEAFLKGNQNQENVLAYEKEKYLKGIKPVFPNPTICNFGENRIQKLEIKNIGQEIYDVSMREEGAIFTKSIKREWKTNETIFLDLEFSEKNINPVKINTFTDTITLNEKKSIIYFMTKDGDNYAIKINAYFGMEQDDSQFCFDTSFEKNSSGEVVFFKGLT